jgi:hypothetical protein
MRNGIEKSIVAQGRSTISNVTNNNTKSTKRIRAESTIIGFVLGILTSIIASYIYDKLLQ